MAPFNPGTGGTIESASIEDALVKILYLYKYLGSSSGGEIRQLSLILDDANNLLTYQGSIEGEISVTESGQIQIKATQYLQFPFNPGTGGTLKANSFGSALVELLYRYRDAEKAIPLEDRKLNLVFNETTNRIEFSGSIGMTITQIDATEYIGSAVGY